MKSFSLPVIKKQILTLSKHLFMVLFFIAVALMLFFAWRERNATFGRKAQVYINLRDVPAFAKKGFDFEDIHKTILQIETGTFNTDNDWAHFPHSGRRIRNSAIDVPRRIFMQPWGEEIQEYTIIFVIETDGDFLSNMKDRQSVENPGIYIAGIAENWEIYFNEKLIISQIHLDENGRIASNRTWRDVHFPLDYSLFTSPFNILTLRILGDPTFHAGIMYDNAPVYMDEYNTILRRQQHSINKILCGIFGFVGFYYLLLFFSVMRKEEIYNLYFGLFSILLCIYTITRYGWINTIIPNSYIAIRLEFVSLMLSAPMYFMFLETLLNGKVTIITRLYLYLSLFLSVTQIFFCLRYGQEVIAVWDIASIVTYTYIWLYSIIYVYYGRKRKEKNNISSTRYIRNILIVVAVIYFCAIYDVIDILFIGQAFHLFHLSVSLAQVAMAYLLMSRFSGLYNKLEQSNIELEAQVRQRTLELEEQTQIAVNSSRAKSDFLAVMSHEIRTPLNAVIGLSEIELGNNLPKSSKENIIGIHESGSFLLGIINDILDISKIETGKFKIIPEEYDTASFINDTVILNKVRIGSKPIQLILEIDKDFPARLTGDQLRIRQIVNNLLSNAIKYTDEGTVTISIGCELLADNIAEIRFTVIDTGIGIRSQDIEKLFKNYEQIDVRADRKVEGTGLGLAIAKKLAELMNGNVTVESEYGKGSCYTARIKQERKDNSVIGDETAQALRNLRYSFDYKNASHTLKERPSIQKGGLSVLAVDDKPLNLLVVRGLLKPYGIQVDTAASGYEAMEKTQTENYSIIFMDHMMPDMDGIQTMQEIRKNKRYANTPIIALTSNALHGMKEFYLAQGFQDFISKPVSARALNEVISKWVNPDDIPGKAAAPSLRQINFLLEINVRRIDKLNHYRAAFETKIEIDDDYFLSFTSLLKSLAAYNRDSDGTVLCELPETLREQAEELIKAGELKDSAAIRSLLPAFCEKLNLQAADNEQGGSVNTNKIIQQLKKALYDKDYKAVEKMLMEWGTVRLSPAQRELYFSIYDALMDDNIEKALERLNN